MQGMSYNDVLSMPTYERRFFLSLKTQEIEKKKEAYEEKESKSVSKSKGNKTTRVSGNALKSKIKNGDLPLN